MSDITQLAMTGQIPGTTPAIPGMFPNMFPSLTSGQFGALAVMPVQAMTQQNFMKDCMGVPLLMEPNFSDYSCQNATQKSQKVFVHVPSEIAAHEVEEIGVEHLLRDLKDTSISTLATEVTGKLAALKGLDARLQEIGYYLDLVVDGSFH